MSELRVEVEALNDTGDSHVVLACGDTVEDAIDDAIARLVAQTGDDSFVMNDWRGLS